MCEPEVRMLPCAELTELWAAEDALIRVLSEVAPHFVDGGHKSSLLACIRTFARQIAVQLSVSHWEHAGALLAALYRYWDAVERLDAVLELAGFVLPGQSVFVGSDADEI